MSAEWTPKKSKKKSRGEDELGEGDEATPASLKGRRERSSIKKAKVKRCIEDECHEDDEHSDANILLLLSASKGSMQMPKTKVLKTKSPSKRALKLLIREAEAEQGHLESGTASACSSSSSSPLKKQKYKRIMKQFVSSIGNNNNTSSTASDSVFPDADRDRDGDGEGDMDAPMWSPGAHLPNKRYRRPATTDYLSPHPESEISLFCSHSSCHIMSCHVCYWNFSIQPDCN